MSKYFAVRHERIGFLISYLIPITWVILLWDSKKIRQGILLIAIIDISSLFINMIGDSIGLGLELFVIATIGFLYVWWQYYSKCITVLKSKNDLVIDK